MENIKIKIKARIDAFKSEKADLKAIEQSIESLLALVFSLSRALLRRFVSIKKMNLSDSDFDLCFEEIRTNIEIFVSKLFNETLKSKDFDSEKITDEVFSKIYNLASTGIDSFIKNKKVEVIYVGEFSQNKPYDEQVDEMDEKVEMDIEHQVKQIIHQTIEGFIEPDRSIVKIFFENGSQIKPLVIQRLLKDEGFDLHEKIISQKKIRSLKKIEEALPKELVLKYLASKYKN